MREDYSPHLESWENVERDAEDEDEDILWEHRVVKDSITTKLAEDIECIAKGNVTTNDAKAQRLQHLQGWRHITKKPTAKNFQK
jgi:hypothetical protein